jgi:hypothetical protein
MGAVTAFARVEMRTTGAETSTATGTAQPEVVRVPLRVSPSTGPWKNVSATWIEPAQVPLLRRLAYALPHTTIVQARVAMTTRGAFVRSSAGIEAIPLGTFYVEVHPNVYVPAGYDVTPAVAPEVLARALGAPASQVLFLGTDARALAVDEAAFAPLETALLEAPPWEPLVAEAIERALEEATLDLKVTPIGLLPLRGVDPPSKVEA